VKGAPVVLLHGCSNRSKHGRSPALAAKHTEQLSAAGAVGAVDRTQSGPERRDRTTAVATVAAAQNGTSGVLAGGKHARRWATLPPLRTGEVGQPDQLPPAPFMSGPTMKVSPHNLGYPVLMGVAI